MARFFTAAFLLALTAVNGSATTLGIAQNFNALVFGNYSSKSDSEGPLAVGGNLNVQNFSLNSHNIPTTWAGVIGADYNATGGGSINGKVIYGGNANVPSYYLSSMTKASLANPLPINFAQAMTDYQNLANGLSGLTGLAPSYVYQGQRGFTGTNSALNVFNLDGPNVAQALTINAPGTSTVIVNVSGKSINWSNFGVSLSGIDRTKVLFNFYEATSITFTNIGLEGSLLAPTANLYLTNGSVNGNAIAQSWNTEITEPHWYPFAGNLPDVAQTPEPGTFFGCGIGCLLIARLATRAKK